MYPVIYHSQPMGNDREIHRPPSVSVAVAY